MKNRYPKTEKLKLKKNIALLFEKGKWFRFGKLQIIVLKNAVEISGNTKFGVSVSKKNFKKAVDRNRIKRLLRECYRLNKDIFKSAFGENSFAMMFWTSEKMPENFKETETEFLNFCESYKL
ncbi:MAG: ribonuclease P protein component [Flavobacteriaceae bacterium]|jgi:ribonuclease P protein component|nr:ribonuclease P protein component [Flavobacteriaceae bacterium]